MLAEDLQKKLNYLEFSIQYLKENEGKGWIKKPGYAQRPKEPELPPATTESGTPIMRFDEPNVQMGGGNMTNLSQASSAREVAFGDPYGYEEKFEFDPNAYPTDPGGTEGEFVNDQLYDLEGDILAAELRKGALNPGGRDERTVRGDAIKAASDAAYKEKQRRFRESMKRKQDAIPGTLGPVEKEEVEETRRRLNQNNEDGNKA